MEHLFEKCSTTKAPADTGDNVVWKTRAATLLTLCVRQESWILKIKKLRGSLTDLFPS